VEQIMGYTKVVGVTYDNDDGTNRQLIISELKYNSIINLKRDYSNLYDPNAIMVVNLSGEQIGFLSRDLASQLAPLIDQGSQIHVEISQLTGGGDYSRGVNILIYDK
jgi:hypothetical protein